MGHKSYDLYKNKKIKLSHLVSVLQQKGHPCNNPLWWLLFGLQIEGPHKCRSTCASLVNRTLVYVSCFLFVQWNGLDEDDRHSRGQVLQASLLYESTLGVPSSTLHEQPMDVCTLSWWTAEVLTVLLGHVTLQAHLVKWPLILSSHRLHDGSQEGLGIEEPSQPNASRHVEVRDPTFKLSDPKQEVSKPGRKTRQRWVSSFSPRAWHLVQEKRIL